MSSKGRTTDLKRKKIVWLSFIPATYLNITADLEILKPLGERYDVYLVGPYLSIRQQLKNPKIHLTSIPIESRPRALIPSIALNTILFLFFPFYIITLKPDFIIVKTDGTVFGFLSTLFLNRCLGTRGSKVILDIRSTPVETVKFPFTFRFTVSVAKRVFDGITIITSLMKNDICKKLGIDQNFVGVWSVGASTTLFDPDKYSLQGTFLKKKLGLLDRFVVLYHGSISPRRGLIESVDAFPTVVDRHPEIVLFILGKGYAEGNLKKLIEEKKIETNVIIHGAVDYVEVPKYIAMCDVGIVPLPNISYWRHQCPLKLLEYLAMKKPVIITDIPAHREIVQDKECGIYISSSAPTEITNAIIYAYENKERLSEWGASGREIIVKKYNWEKAAESLEKYLLSLKN